MNEILLQRTSPIQQLKDLESKVQKKSTGPGGASFKDFLTEAVETVDKAHQASDQEIKKVLSGELQDVHSAMIAMQKADLSFQMMMQVRNKLLEAYQEVMRMQV